MKSKLFAILAAVMACAISATAAVDVTALGDYQTDLTTAITGPSGVASVLKAIALAGLGIGVLIFAVRKGWGAFRAGAKG